MMRTRRKQIGFSLTEVLLATGILAVGFVLIAMVFPAGIKLTSMAAEKTLGPAIAEEAIAKVRLYGLDLSLIAAQNTFYLFPGQRPGAGAPGQHLDPQSEKYLYKKLIKPSFDPLNDTIPPGDITRLYVEIAARMRNEEGIYPSLPAAFFKQNPDQPRRYSWSAIYRRRFPEQDIQVLVFVSRKAGNIAYCGVLLDASTGLYKPAQNLEFPVPIPVSVNFTPPDRVAISTSGNTFFTTAQYEGFFTVGMEMADESNGRIYQVIEKQGNVFRIAGDLTGINPARVWVVPPGVNSQRYPCIGIYEAVIN